MTHCDDITVHIGCAPERPCLHSGLMSTLTEALTSSSQDSSQTPQRIVHLCSCIVDQIAIESTRYGPTPHDNDEGTWLQFRFKLENHVTLVKERYIQLLHDAKSRPVAKIPAGTDEASVPSER